MSDSRPDSRASGPTIMSAGGSESPMVAFRSAMDVGNVQTKKDGTHQARITSGRNDGACGSIAQRYVFAVMCSFALAITYGLKVNFHVCIVAMINHSALASGGEKEEGGGRNCREPATANGTEGEEHPLQDGPFEWDPIVQGVLLSSYFYGYLVTQVIGGRLAEVFSAKWTFFVSITVTAVFTLLTPMAANIGWGYLLAARVFEGMMGGVTLPATHVLLSKWTPKSEMSQLSSAVYAGLSLGTVLSVSITGLTAGTVGWELVFYTQGGASVVFVIFWAVLVYDSPSSHPWISNTEKNFILDSTGQDHGSKESPPVPWKQIWTSIPFWSVLVSHTGSNWGWYMLLTELPSYMSGILGFDMKENALVSALPFLVMWLYSVMFGSLMDHLGSRGIITRTGITKLSTAIAAYIPAACMLLVTFVGCNTGLAVFLLTLATGTFGSMYSGFLSNHINIAPVFAGTLMAITNTFATIPGVVVPSFVGMMIHDSNTVERWRIIFFITAAVLGLEATQYMFFASGEEQEWSKKARGDNDNFEAAAGH